MRFALLLSTLLAGCVMTPTDIKDAKNATRYDSSLSPMAVANCLTRNHVNSGGSYAPIVTEAAGGMIEYSMKDPRYGLMHLYAEISPAPGGSTVMMWILSPYLRKTIEDGMLKGC